MRIVRISKRVARAPFDEKGLRGGRRQALWALRIPAATAGSSARPSHRRRLRTDAVATRTDREVASGAKQITRYRYEGLKAERGGRGMLGFRRMQQEDTTPAGLPMTVVTEYLQVHPYIGVASRTQTFLRALDASSGTLLSTTENSYCDVGSTTAPDAATPDAPCAPGSLIARPYLARTLESGQDLSGSALPQVETVSRYNQYGDAEKITVNTWRLPGDVEPFSSKVTTNIFCLPDVISCPEAGGPSPNRISGSDWILGRLSKSTVVSKTSGVMLPASAGSAALATAIKGSPPPGTPMAINPSVLQAITSLVLEE
jgi:hypothetical protein